MRILIVGAGGREHALAWKLSQEAEVFASPGNPGIAECAECFESDDLARSCRERAIDFVVIGPENPLIDGLADKLRAQGIVVFGPGADGAKLEGSKAFAKQMMIEAGVPTAAYRAFTDPNLALEFAKKTYEEGRQLAVKASGAALGKGVVVASTHAEAEDAIEMMMVDGELGEAGREVVLEERLMGWEYSLMAVCSGEDYITLPLAQDYKRALDGDRGPNTGGMGTVSPPLRNPPDAAAEQVIAPILRSLKSRGIDYRGLIFAGLLVQEGKPYCLEYNVRFGDPETQSIVRRIGPGLGELLNASARGLPLPGIEELPNSAATVVMASAGYPGPYEKGLPITLPAGIPENVQIFHAGTTLGAEGLVTNGGRVLCISATGMDIEEARAGAYGVCSQIEWSGAWFRKDIGNLPASSN